MIHKILFGITIINICCLINIIDKDSLNNYESLICISNTITFALYLLLIIINIININIIFLVSVPNILITNYLGSSLLENHKFIIDISTKFIMSFTYYMFTVILLFVIDVLSIIIILHTLIPFKEENINCRLLIHKPLLLTDQNQNHNPNLDIETPLISNNTHKCFLEIYPNFKQKIFTYVKFLGFLQIYNILIFFYAKKFHILIFCNVIDSLLYIVLVDFWIYIKRNTIKIDKIKMGMILIIILSLLINELAVTIMSSIYGLQHKLDILISINDILLFIKIIILCISLYRSFESDIKIIINIYIN
jgi:hypothetical protein